MATLKANKKNLFNKYGKMFNFLFLNTFIYNLNLQTQRTLYKTFVVQYYYKTMPSPYRLWIHSIHMYLLTKIKQNQQPRTNIVLNLYLIILTLFSFFCNFFFTKLALIANFVFALSPNYYVILNRKFAFLSPAPINNFNVL